MDHCTGKQILDLFDSAAPGTLPDPGRYRLYLLPAQKGKDGIDDYQASPRLNRGSATD